MAERRTVGRGAATDRKGAGRSGAKAGSATYTNRLGQTYSVRSVAAARGGVRYIATRGDAAEAATAMPEGYTFAENVHGQVTVRRVRPSRFLPGEVDSVRGALALNLPTAGYRAEEVQAAIVIYHPVGHLAAFAADPVEGSGPEAQARLLAELRDAIRGDRGREAAAAAHGAPGPARRDAVLAALGRALLEARLERAAESMPTQYAEILRLRLDHEEPRGFVLERRYFRGQGGWQFLDYGEDPAALLGPVLAALGPDGPTEAFFDLM